MRVIPKRFILIPISLLLVLISVSACTAARYAPQETRSPAKASPTMTHTVSPAVTPTALGFNSTEQSPSSDSTNAEIPFAASPTPAGSPTPELSTTATSAEPVPAYAAGYHLVLDERFTGSDLNQLMWNSQFRWGNTNTPELEEYLPGAIHIQDGMLVLTASPSTAGKHPYASGMIASYDRFFFQYGVVEVRAKIPKGKGLWSAFWLLAQDQKSANEIDVMEILGNDPNTVHMTTHFNGPDENKNLESGSFQGSDFSLDFHTFAIQWQWDRITWFIDGQEVFKVTDHIPREPMYLLANLAVGGVWTGAPDKTTKFPASMQIDHIRVYAP